MLAIRFGNSDVLSAAGHRTAVHPHSADCGAFVAETRDLSPDSV